MTEELQFFKTRRFVFVYVTIADLNNGLFCAASQGDVDRKLSTTMNKHITSEIDRIRYNRDLQVFLCKSFTPGASDFIVMLCIEASTL